MQTPSEQGEASGVKSPAAVQSQVRLLRAQELAQAGDYEAALVLLLQMEPSTASLDMRARIEVQRGRYADARALWNEVLEMSPGHAGAKKGLRDVERAAARGKILRIAGIASLVVALGALALLVLDPKDEPTHAPAADVHMEEPVAPPTAAARPAPEPAAAVEPVKDDRAAAAPTASAPTAAAPTVKAPSTAAAPTAAAPTAKATTAAPANTAPAAAPAGVAATAKPARSIAAPLAAAPAKAPSQQPRAAAGDSALPDITLPQGVTLTRDGAAQVYSFDTGLFIEGVAFFPGARERVTALGRALAPHMDSIKVELIGYVDTVPLPAKSDWRDNTSLALSRANAVLGRLVRTTKFPAEQFGLRAVGQRLGPHSKTQGDPRNRTVDIRVSPR